MKPAASPLQRRLRWLAPLLCALALWLPAAAMAQAPGFSAADQADIQNFTLNEDVFNRLQAVVEQGRAMHIKKTQLDMSKVHSLDDMAKQLVAANPKVKPLLASHGFTPRQFLVANLTLVRTVVLMQSAQGSKQEKAMESRLNPANVRFYKAHKAQMDALVHPAASASSASP